MAIGRIRSYAGSLCQDPPGVRYQTRFFTVSFLRRRNSLGAACVCRGRFLHLLRRSDANVAASGGVKFNRRASILPALRPRAFGNVPFARDEWVAARITAYFNLDIRQICAFGLGVEVERLLIALALFKIRKFLAVGLRLRTACDLDLDGIMVTRPEGFELPELADLERELPELIETVRSGGHFGESPVLTVTYKK